MNNKKKMNLTGFTSVDLFQGSFGSVSVKAIFSIYSQLFQKSAFQMKNISFYECVESLRHLENPDYKTKYTYKKK